mmetsp:Transcript_32405/g.70854  ORF Transcript_32405/g.70854 Transcript_32405/m.70854 type:complete len:204 (-) Transcript_32405:2313-2924(-)
MPEIIIVVMGRDWDMFSSKPAMSTPSPYVPEGSVGLVCPVLRPFLPRRGKASSGGCIMANGTKSGASAARALPKLLTTAPASVLPTLPDCSSSGGAGLSARQALAASGHCLASSLSSCTSSLGTGPQPLGLSLFFSFSFSLSCSFSCSFSFSFSFSFAFSFSLSCSFWLFFSRSFSFSFSFSFCFSFSFSFSLTASFSCSSLS